MKKKNFTIADIRHRYPEEKRKVDKDDPWLYFVVRPVSFYPTWLFLRLGISANQTTFIGFIISISGCVFFALGNYRAIIVGAILINIGFLFDVMDGNIARFTTGGTKYGEYIDKITGYFTSGVLPLAIGIGLYRLPDPYLNYLFSLFFGIDVSNSLYLLLGVIYSFSILLRLLLTEGAGLTFSMTPRDIYKPNVGFEKSKWGLVYRFGVGLQRMTTPILLVVTIANVLSIFIALWTLVTICAVVTVASRTLIEATKIDKSNHT